MPTINLNPEEINKALKNLLNNDVFSNSQRNIKILSFLIECHLKDIHVKEALIEAELFQSSKQSTNYEGKVRVYMFNLRKKLDEYYRTNGANDQIVFKIEKGQYNLTIELSEQKSSTKNNKKIITLYTLLATLCIIAAISIIRYNAQNKYCWNHFLNNNTTNSICYIGDHYILSGNLPNGRSGAVYIDNINNDNDFKVLKEDSTYNYTNLKKARFSFITKMAPVAASKLTQWFTENDQKLSIELESEMSLNDLKNNNIIFIGPYKTMVGLNDLFLRNSKDYSFDGLSIIDIENNKTIHDTRINNSRNDHVMVSFNKLSDNGKDILFFASNNDIGVMSTVKNFTNPTWLEEFYTNLPHEHAYFNALFSVSGVGRTDLECRLIHIEVLD